MAQNLIQFLFLVLLLYAPSVLTIDYCNGGIIPGVDKMLHGVDLTELDLLPLDLQQRSGWRKTFLELTCSEQGTWRHPSDDKKIDYSRPDQIAGVSTNPAGLMDLATQFTDDSTDYRRSRAMRAGLSLDTGLYGSYSASFGYSDVQKNLIQKNRTIAETSSTVSAYVVDFKTAPFLTPNADFTDYLKSHCSVSYAANHTAYEEFIRIFGTHYFETAIFGGHLYQRSLIKNDYIYTTDSRSVTTDLEASFASFIKSSIHTQDNTTKTSDGFKANTEMHFIYYGGAAVNVKPNDTGFMGEWVPLVIRSPWLLGGVLKPIETLINNVTVRAEVGKAITIHRARAYFAELKQMIELTGYKPSADESRQMALMETKLAARSSEDVPTFVEQIDLMLVHIENYKARQELTSALNRCTTLDRQLDCVLERLNQESGTIPWFPVVSPAVKEAVRRMRSQTKEHLDKLWDYNCRKEMLTLSKGRRHLVPFIRFVKQFDAKDRSDGAIANEKIWSTLCVDPPKPIFEIVRNCNTIKWPFEG